METLLELLNKRYVAPYAIVVFTLLSITMVVLCGFNYYTTFSAFNAAMPVLVAIAATAVVQLLVLAIPILAAWNISEHLGWNRQTKLALLAVLILALMTSFLSSINWLINARQDTSWSVYAIAGVFSLIMCFSEYGVVVSIIITLVAYNVWKHGEAPGWLSIAGEPAVNKPIRNFVQSSEACGMSFLDPRMRMRDSHPLPPVSAKPPQPSPTQAPTGVTPLNKVRTTREGNVICYCSDKLMHWFTPDDHRLETIPAQA